MNNLNEHRFPYKWFLKNGYPAKGIEPHDRTVFSTFSCGGGSTMGYKLAGYKVIGANDIDNQMRNVYITNHHPKYYVFGDIRKLLEKNYPEEFYNLDILDGSPPCSTFSDAGVREKGWQKEKVFREGQKKQILDDLFFEFIQLAKKLQPKVVISENVKGLIRGNAKGYFVEIIRKFDEAGYNTSAFLLNASTMGVPQRRERVFFISSRKDLNLPKIELSFNEDPILFKEYSEQNISDRPITKREKHLWDNRKFGDNDLSDITKRLYDKDHNYTTKFVYPEDVIKTITTHSDAFILYDESRRISKLECLLSGSFPMDYDFYGLSPFYLIGMSVPPIMMAQISYQVYKQWLSKI